MGSVSVIRQRKILDLLRDQKTLKIQDLVEALGVSIMTIHRDLNQLEAAGQVTKFHGGATLPREHPSRAIQPQRCDFCGSLVQPRLAFIIYGTEGQPTQTCCPHCGFLALSREAQSDMALAADFLYGQMVSIQRATFLVESDVSVCCSPSILTFSNPQDAQRFQRGFGGRLMMSRQVQQFLQGLTAPGSL